MTSRFGDTALVHYRHISREDGARFFVSGARTAARRAGRSGAVAAALAPPGSAPLETESGGRGDVGCQRTLPERDFARGSSVAQGQTILVVDDDSHIREVVCFALKKAGFLTVEASNGLEGVSKSIQPGS